MRLFVACWVIYALHFATNTVREIYPALSLGDHLSVDVSEYVGFHPDIFALAGRGAFINNNPGASILGAIPYAMSRPLIDPIVAAVQRARAATPGPAANYDSIYPMAQEFYQMARARGLDVKFGLAAAVMQGLLMAPLSALSVVVMFYILLSLTSSIRNALLLALLYAFATPVLYRTAQLNQNLLVAHCALFAFALLWKPWDKQQTTRPRYLFAGLLSGWAVVLDYSGVVVAIALSLYALYRRSVLPAKARSRSDLLHWAGGVALSVTGLLAYQWLAFGNPLLPAQHYMPATRYSGYGYSGIDMPHLDLLWETAFGMRFGLFASAPLLLLALYVPAWFGSRSRLLRPVEVRFIVLFSIAFFLFSASNLYGYLQFNSGVRHIVPVTPFLFLLAVNVLLQLPTRVAIVFGLTSTFWSWCLAMYRDVEQGQGIVESPIHIILEGIRLPWLTTLEHLGYLSHEGMMVLSLALIGIAACVVWYAIAPVVREARPAMVGKRETV